AIQPSDSPCQENKTMSNQLATTGQQFALSLHAKGYVNEKGTLVGARKFIAAKAGFTEDLKDMKTSKMVAKIVEQKLATKEDCKLWSKEYDAGRQEFYAQSAVLGGAFVASPEWRKSTKAVHNAKGEFIGVNIAVRRERSKSVSNATKVAA